MMRGTGLPSSASIICSAAIWPMRARASMVTPAMCGVTKTLSYFISGCSPGAGDFFVAQHALQRLLVVDRAARRRNKVSGRLHQRVFARADQVAGFRRERAIDRDEVGAPKELVEFDLGGAAGAHRGGVEIRVVGQHVHAKQHAGEFGDAAADMA